MQDSWTSVLIAAAVLVLSVGLFLLCRAGAKYLDRAKAPDAIDFGFRFSMPSKSIWLGIQGAKENSSSKKGHQNSNDDGLSS